MDGLRLILRGVVVICCRIPKTIANSTKALVCRHYLFLAMVFSIIGYQFVCNANMKMERDAANKKLIEYELKQDSLTHTSYRYVSFDTKI